MTIMLMSSTVRHPVVQDPCCLNPANLELGIRSIRGSCHPRCVNGFPIQGFSPVSDPQSERPGGTSASQNPPQPLLLCNISRENGVSSVPTPSQIDMDVMESLVGVKHGLGVLGGNQQGLIKLGFCLSVVVLFCG